MAHLAPARQRPAVLLLVQLPPPNNGVTAVNETILESKLLARKFDFRVIPLRFARDNADVGRFRPVKILKALAITLRLAWTLATCRPAAVYFTLCPRGGGFLRDILFVTIIKIMRVRRIYHLHGKGVQEACARSRLLKALYAWSLSRADVIHLSPTLFGDVSAYVHSDRLFAVPNGCAGPETPLRRKTERNRDVRVSFISSMLKAKGPLVLLEALSVLKERGVMFGAEFAGPWREPEVKEEFYRLLSHGDMSQQVRHIGTVGGARKHQFFLRADILVVPTLWDAFPLVAIEAMAYELPVVATREGALIDIVEDERTGYLVPKNNPMALADALQRLVENAELRHGMGTAGRHRYEQNYRQQHFEAKLGEVLEICIMGAPHCGRKS